MILQISTRICLAKKKNKKRNLQILQRKYWRFVWDFECSTRSWFKLISIQMNTGKPSKLLIASPLGISHFSLKLLSWLLLFFNIVLEALGMCWKWLFSDVWRDGHVGFFFFFIYVFYMMKLLGMVIWHGSGRREFEATCIQCCSLSFTKLSRFWVLILRGSW